MKVLALIGFWGAFLVLCWPLATMAFCLCWYCHEALADEARKERAAERSRELRAASAQRRLAAEAGGRSGGLLVETEALARENAPASPEQLRRWERLARGRRS